MKLGSFEGTPQELKDLCENHGFEPSIFLSVPPQVRVKIWMIIIMSLLFAISCIIMWTSELPETISKTLIVIDLIFIILLTILVHLKYQRWEATILVLIGCSIILSLCLDFITPKEAIDNLRNTPLHQESN